MIAATSATGLTGRELVIEPTADVYAYARLEAAVREELMAAGASASAAALDAAVTRVVTMVSRFTLEWANA